MAPKIATSRNRFSDRSAVDAKRSTPPASKTPNNTSTPLKLTQAAPPHPAQNPDQGSSVRVQNTNVHFAKQSPENHCHKNSTGKRRTNS